MRHRSTEVITLPRRAAERRQRPGEFKCLDPFGSDRQRLVRQADNSGRKRQRIEIRLSLTVIGWVIAGGAPCRDDLKPLGRWVGSKRHFV
jgi:hypothetical protein